MNTINNKSIIFLFTICLLLTACKTSRIVNKSCLPIQNKGQIAYKQTELTEEELQAWSHMDIIRDSIPGISLKKAVQLVANKKAKNSIVAILDSGVDIEHKALAGHNWLNNDELNNNGIDDDHNGYIDDIHGWNFLGSETEDILFTPYSLTRLLVRYQDNQEAVPNYTEKQNVFDSISEKLGESYASFGQRTRSTLSENAKEYHQRLQTQLMYHYNMNFSPREIIGDNPHDFSDRDYGNPRIKGLGNIESHGTHVTGILTQIVNQFTDAIKFMPLRAIPNGDEYDKDVALAIRYAVDNGAKVINMSFGKSYSEHPDWVQEAIKYAASKDVLLVHAAGNKSKNIDLKDNFPSDNIHGKEIADNMITVGAITRYFNEALLLKISNYGKQNVDLFAPGSNIYSTLPNDNYGYNMGTSMAAPAVAAVAALIRSYYPKLSASQVKHILMKSGVEVPFEVIVPGHKGKKLPFKKLCKSDRILNAYNALLMAEKVSKKIK